MELNDIAEMLCRNLISEGFIIQRYDAYSSNSIYLKLDYGACNSIRISDHPGKKYLKYRYNIGPYVKEFQEVKDKFPRIYYRETKSQSLLKRIIRDKSGKLQYYGKEKYKKLMEENRSLFLGRNPDEAEESTHELYGCRQQQTFSGE